MNFRTLLMAGTALIAFSNPVLADERDDRIQMLEQQVQMLAAEIQTLKQEQKQDRQAVAVIEQNMTQKIEKAGVSTPNENPVKVTMNPSPKIEYGDFSWQPFGRIQLDYAAFNDDKRDHPDGAEFRRARLGMKGQIAKDFGYKAEIDFANEGVNFKDVYMNYTGIENTEIRIGNFKPPMGLEELTSGNDITFIERSAATSAFATGEIIGAGVSTHGEDWLLSGGLFNDDAGRQSSDDEAWSAGVRGTYAPLHESGKVVHIGGSATYRKPDQANDSFDFDATTENALQSTDSVSANFTNADNAQLYGLEAAGVLGPFSAQGEYFLVDVERTNGRSNLDFSGGYAQASWVLTGESRSYSAKDGKFGTVKPAHAFNPRNGEWGAVELAARYSTIDVTDQDISGGEMDNYTLGANWYLNNNMRLMANYIFVDTDNSAVTPNDDPQILLLRSQVNF